VEGTQESSGGGRRGGSGEMCRGGGGGRDRMGGGGEVWAAISARSALAVSDSAHMLVDKSRWYEDLIIRDIAASAAERIEHNVDNLTARDRAHGSENAGS